MASSVVLRLRCPAPCRPPPRYARDVSVVATFQPKVPHHNRDPLPASIALDFHQAHHRVLLSLGYYVLLRCSEYLARCNILFIDNGGTRATDRDTANSVTVIFKSSKTDRLGESTTRTLSRSGSSWLCPEPAAWALVAEGTNAGRPEASPMCALPEGSIPTADGVTRWIKLAARQCGHDETRYSIHSLRSGGATALFSAGSAVMIIKLHNRWRSDCFQRYIHINNASTTNISRTYDTGRRSRASRKDKDRRIATLIRGSPQEEIWLSIRLRSESTATFNEINSRMESDDPRETGK
ncbi:hypothetical protein PHPALM_30623 [Phytophthora palmivora]|uniref:Tyr recombinase domain-containing protein n=1 Tax=Phytophthora palmivora TaxID=4796 RepID=A0A2P4X4P8_9STRA|nr:hypothetical protein PHPALM_30623 [Phytophthora palmivora]